MATAGKAAPIVGGAEWAEPCNEWVEPCPDWAEWREPGTLCGVEEAELCAYIMYRVYIGINILSATSVAGD